MCVVAVHEANVIVSRYEAVNDLAAMSMEMLEYHFHRNGHVLTDRMIDHYVMPTIYGASSVR